MNPIVKQLIPAVAFYVKDKESNLSKTKLLKLLYLIDVEYYRLHQKTFTGFQWKFFHLGPWTNEIDPLLDELVHSGELVSRPYSSQEYDSYNYEAENEIDISSLFTSVKDEGAIKRVLSRWADRSVGEILDYVYFHTEPMEQGIRNAPLDFSLISSQPPERYIRSSSGTSPKEAERLRRAIVDKLASLRNQQTSVFEFTPPRYDEEFSRALSKLDESPA
jgi:hypothetical protein